MQATPPYCGGFWTSNRAHFWWAAKTNRDLQDQPGRLAWWLGTYTHAAEHVPVSITPRKPPSPYTPPYRGSAVYKTWRRIQGLFTSLSRILKRVWQGQMPEDDKKRTAIARRFSRCLSEERCQKEDSTRWGFARARALRLSLEPGDKNRSSVNFTWKHSTSYYFNIIVETCESHHAHSLKKKVTTITQVWLHLESAKGDEITVWFVSGKLIE